VYNIIPHPTNKFACHQFWILQNTIQIWTLGPMGWKTLCNIKSFSIPNPVPVSLGLKEKEKELKPLGLAEIAISFPFHVRNIASAWIIRFQTTIQLL
jgi:hypothetical protein